MYLGMGIALSPCSVFKYSSVICSSRFIIYARGNPKSLQKSHFCENRRRPEVLFFWNSGIRNCRGQQIELFSQRGQKGTRRLLPSPLSRLFTPLHLGKRPPQKTKGGPFHGPETPADHKIAHPQGVSFFFYFIVWISSRRKNLPGYFAAQGRMAARWGRRVWALIVRQAATASANNGIEGRKKYIFPLFHPCQSLPASAFLPPNSANSKILKKQSTSAKPIRRSQWHCSTTGARMFSFLSGRL